MTQRALTPAATHHVRLALRNAADRARRAPSIHNTQPWRMQLTGNALVLKLDRARVLPAVDPQSRQAWISCGCALFNARAYLAGEDRDYGLTRFPEGDGSDVFARLEPGGHDRTDSYARKALADLEPTIVLRRTVRTRFATDPPSSGLISRVEAAAAAESAILVAIRHDDHRDAIARLARRADALQNADPRYRAELRRWTTDNTDRTDGVQSRAVPHVNGTSEDEIPIRDFDTRGNASLPADTHSTRHQTMLLLGTSGDARADWLRAGEALERVLLEITRYGYATSPLMQALEVPQTRAELRRALGLTWYPQFMLRVGRAAPTAPTPRRALADLLTEEAAR